MPGATGVTIAANRTELSSGYTPRVGDWLCLEAGRYSLSGTDSATKACVVGAVYEVTPTNVRIVQIGSFVPLKTLGSLAELQALTSPIAYLAANGRAGDRPSGVYSRRLFTIPIPVASLTSTLLESVYVLLECDSASLTPAP